MDCIETRWLWHNPFGYRSIEKCSLLTGNSSWCRRGSLLLCRPLSTAYKMFCMQLTKAYMVETSCNHCYWFCYVSAINNSSSWYFQHQGSSSARWHCVSYQLERDFYEQVDDAAIDHQFWPISTCPSFAIQQTEHASTYIYRNNL